MDPQHVDTGSLVTVDILLTDGFEGGRFSTTHDDGAVTRPPFERPGDVVIFSSAQRHHVTRVTSGVRQVLVLEFWSGEPRSCPHRCSQRVGACRGAPRDAAEFFDACMEQTFFLGIDEAAMCAAMDALRGDSRGGGGPG